MYEREQSSWLLPARLRVPRIHIGPLGLEHKGMAIPGGFHFWRCRLQCSKRYVHCPHLSASMTNAQIDYSLDRPYQRQSGLLYNAGQKWMIMRQQLFILAHLSLSFDFGSKFKITNHPPSRFWAWIRLEENISPWRQLDTMHSWSRDFTERLFQWTFLQSANSLDPELSIKLTVVARII